jgi:hypothetical protein
MTKKLTPFENTDELPLNMPEDGDIDSMIALAVGVTSIEDPPLLGALTLSTRDGHFDFLINEEMANAIVQELRTFLRGDSPSLDAEED